MSVRPVLKHPRHVSSFLQASRHNALPRPYSTTRAVEPPRASLTSVLIANRGEIALRVGRTASESGIRTTTIYTEPDAHSQHALSSPFAINIGEPNAYLNGDRIIEIAKREGCQGIHPGYGFLSENSEFARKCAEAGIIFIGPPWKAIQAMGSKSESKDIMIAAGVPCIPGYHGANQDPDALQAEAAKIGYPVLLKAVKGGGGKGMRIARTAAEFKDQLISAQSEARNSFGDDRMLVEKYIITPRHIEVQVFADSHGNCVALGERDCSIQRRHQKILEESPAPFLAQDVRHDLWSKARAAALAVGYEGAGTVEFIFDNDTGEFFFMEMNTRLQVEHPVTEMVTGEDLVRWQFVVAEGGKLPLTQAEVEARIAERGWAVEARIYAENPEINFMPDSGRLVHLRTPAVTETIRIDAGFAKGDEITPFYDPMIAKLIVRGATRPAAILKLKAALEDYEVVGPSTNIEFLKRICQSSDFLAGKVETGFIEKHHEELFVRQYAEDEVFAQAALWVLLDDMKMNDRRPAPFKLGGSTTVGFPVSSGRDEASASQHQRRSLWFNEHITTTANDPTRPDEAATPVQVSVLVGLTQHDRPRGASPTITTTFDVELRGKHYSNVTAQYSPIDQRLTTFYPHTRLSTTIIPSPCRTKIHLFQRGRHYILNLTPPSWWLLKTSNSSMAGRSSSQQQQLSSSNNVVAPMPCKVLRVQVEEGEEVKRDQALVVIESMKMETVVRSPRDAVVGRVVGRQGDMCKAGSALVEFL